MEVLGSYLIATAKRRSANALDEDAYYRVHDFRQSRIRRFAPALMTAVILVLAVVARAA